MSHSLAVVMGIQWACHLQCHVTRHVTHSPSGESQVLLAFLHVFLMRVFAVLLVPGLQCQWTGMHTFCRVFRPVMQPVFNIVCKVLPVFLQVSLLPLPVLLLYHLQVAHPLALTGQQNSIIAFQQLLQLDWSEGVTMTPILAASC